jgi:8-oxo-dGTP pyrophosphatase MutT (NUDIX family)
MDPGETIEQTIVREVKEETGLEAKILWVLSEYIEKGVKDEVDYEYYPTCFVMEPIGGELKKQDSEIKEMKLFSLDALPKPLAFEHEKMIEDYVSHQKKGVKP